MKKILSVVLVVMFAVACFAVPSSAVDNTSFHDDHDCEIHGDTGTITTENTSVGATCSECYNMMYFYTRSWQDWRSGNGWYANHFCYVNFYEEYYQCSACGHIDWVVIAPVMGGECVDHYNICIRTCDFCPICTPDLFSGQTSEPAGTAFTTEGVSTEGDVIWYCSHCGEGRIVLSCTGNHDGDQCFRSGVCSYCGYTQNYLGPCV